MAFDRYDEQVYMAYIEDELLPDEAGTFEELLQDVNDPRLGQLIGNLKQDRSLVQSLPRESAPPRIMQNIGQIIEREKQLHPYEAEVEEEAAGAGNGNIYLWIAGAVAAVVFLGVLVLFAVKAMGSGPIDPTLQDDVRQMAEDLQQQREQREQEQARPMPQIQSPSLALREPAVIADQAPQGSDAAVSAPVEASAEQVAELSQVQASLTVANAGQLAQVLSLWGVDRGVLVALNGQPVQPRVGVHVADAGIVTGNGQRRSAATQTGVVNSALDQGSKAEVGVTQQSTLTISAKPAVLAELLVKLEQFSQKNSRESVEFLAEGQTFSAADMAARVKTLPQDKPVDLTIVTISR